MSQADEGLRSAVASANREIALAQLVALSFGNASVADREADVMGIKPSGLACARITEADVVILRISDGKVIDGRLRPSSDAPTHLALYRAFPEIGGIVHTHSTHATAWAQAEQPIPCLGTTHADHFRGPVGVTRRLSSSEVAEDYEANTGKVIVELFGLPGVDPLDLPAALVASHGPFTWGRSGVEAVENAVALELVARIALETRLIRGDPPSLDDLLLQRHFRRKHGSSAYYGQR